MSQTRTWAALQIMLTILLYMFAAGPGQADDSAMSSPERLEIVEQIPGPGPDQVTVTLHNFGRAPATAYVLEHFERAAGATARLGWDSFPSSIDSFEAAEDTSLVIGAGQSRTLVLTAPAADKWNQPYRLVGVLYADGDFGGEPGIVRDLFDRRLETVRSWRKELSDIRHALERGTDAPGAGALRGSNREKQSRVPELTVSGLEARAFQVESQLAKVAPHVPDELLESVEEPIGVQELPPVDRAIADCSMSQAVFTTGTTACPMETTETWALQCSSGQQASKSVTGIGACSLFLDCPPIFRTTENGITTEGYKFRREGATMDVAFGPKCVAKSWAFLEAICPCSDGGSEETTTTTEGCPGKTGCTPIVLDLGGDGFSFTAGNQGVSFDLDADGKPEPLSWTDPSGNEAFLFLDRNQNGRVDDGLELFGDLTPQPPHDSPNGYRALEVYDQPNHGGNDDGKITSEDDVFASLRLWRDANHDGVSQPGEIHRLDEHGITALHLDFVEARRRDRNGNRLHWFGATDWDGSRRLGAVDVTFFSPR